MMKATASMPSPQARRSIFVLCTAAILLLAAVLSFGFYLFAVKHYHVSMLRYLFRFRAVSAYLFDPKVRRLVDLVEDQETAEEKGGTFATVWDTNEGVLLSRKLFREVEMYGVRKYMYHPYLKKLSFRTGAAGLYRKFETVDSRDIRTALASLDTQRLVTASYDQFGFRRVDANIARDCEVRVLFLGDSFTDGLWVNDDETFVNRYGHLVRGRLDLRVCPVNAGVNGYGSLEEAYVLEHYFEATGRPRLVIVMHFPNDIDADYDAVLNGTVANSRSKWDESLSYLRRMAEFSRQHGALMVLAAIPPSGQMSHLSTRSNYQEVLRVFCAKEKIPFIDVMNGFRTFREDAIYWQWDPHFTPRGHQVVAEILYDETRTILASLPASH
jgi:lysophospholipase L1-like esterase